MEGDYWAKTYGRYAKLKEEAPIIDGAENMAVRDLLAYLDGVIPKFADEELSDLQYLLKMARTEASDILSGARVARATSEHLASPTPIARGASGE